MQEYTCERRHLNCFENMKDKGLKADRVTIAPLVTAVVRDGDLCIS